MSLMNDVVDFIQNNLRHDMTEKELVEWSDKYIDDLADIYEKHREKQLSYVFAEMTMFFIRSIYGRDDDIEIISKFVAYQ
jgi:hypothetical protein